MSLEELKSLLETTGYPVAYSHFTSKKNPPFVCYLVTPSDNFSADNTTYHEVINVDIELYTKIKDETAENKIKKLLNEHELPWEYDEQYIQSEGVFQCTFSIQLA